MDRRPGNKAGNKPGAANRTETVQSQPAQTGPPMRKNRFICNRRRRKRNPLYGPAKEYKTPIAKFMPNIPGLKKEIESDMVVYSGQMKNGLTFLAFFNERDYDVLVEKPDAWIYSGKGQRIPGTVELVKGNGVPRGAQVKHVMQLAKSRYYENKAAGWKYYDDPIVMDYPVRK